MTWERTAWIRAAAASGFISVAAGALAAHGLSDPGRKSWMGLGANYQAVHALAILACAAIFVENDRRGRWPTALFMAGSALFCGSLYALALGAPAWVGVATPVGGVLLMAGWACLAWAARGRTSAP